jgi:hypothetical protein
VIAIGMRQVLDSVYISGYFVVLHKLTPWSRVLFKALTVAKRVNIAHYVLEPKGWYLLPG